MTIHHTMFEMRTNLTSTTQADAGGTAPLVDNAGLWSTELYFGFHIRHCHRRYRKSGEVTGNN